MIRTSRRELAERLCSVLRMASPSRVHAWADALRHEIDNIEDDTEALRFAVSGFFGLFPRALLSHLQILLGAFSRNAGRSTAAPIMARPLRPAWRAPQTVGPVCVSTAVMLGLAYMAAAGAPWRYLAVNLAALGIGLSILKIMGRSQPAPRRYPGLSMVGLAILLLGTALFGDRIEGAARWLRLGPLFIQTSLLFVPLMIMAFARHRTLVSTAVICAAAAALALQPDRGMAGMLAASIAALVILRADKYSLAAMLAAAIAFCMTLARPDTLPAMPYVDQIYYSAFHVHPLAGLAVIAGASLLLVPAIAAWPPGRVDRELNAVFGAIWLSIIVAAALGNYPTPVVGYGGSAIIGYLLSVVWLPGSSSAHATPAPGSTQDDTGPGCEGDRHRLFKAPYRSARTTRSSTQTGTTMIAP